jgi:eukaryotic-like serine/threonine-protein kinase
MTKATLSYIGPYRLLNVVNTSQTTQIWQAYDDGKKMIVGIKTPLAKYHKNREQIGFLRWEYKVARSVVHPRILNMFTFDVQHGIPYLAMEWFPGANMKQLLLGGTARIGYLLPKIIDQAAEALAHFGTRGWVHRDIKPDNFLVSESGDVKLIDFSLARKAKRGLAKLFSRKSKVQGTRTYMSPEQIRGEPLDQRADVYSFGCALFELISGKPPFTGSSQQDLFTKHLKTPPPVLDPVGHNVTPEFAQLLRRTLAKNPAERVPSVAEFLNETRRTKIFRLVPRAPQNEPS